MDKEEIIIKNIENWKTGKDTIRDKMLNEYEKIEKCRRYKKFKTCMDCGKYVRKFRESSNGKQLCFNCYKKTMTDIYIPSSGRKCISLKEALNKKYLVKTYINKKTLQSRQSISLPQILIRHTVKLKLTTKKQKNKK